MDYVVFSLLDPYSGRWIALDHFMGLVANSSAIKGLPVAILFLFLWFRPSGTQIRTRLRLLALLLITGVAIASGRLLALTLPFRERPIRAEGLDLTLPAGINPESLDGWSAFPSDHAVLYAALATGFWCVSRWAGILATLHALFVIAFARVFLTLHYPTDILAGAAIGCITALVLMRPLERALDRIGVLGLSDRHPELVNPLLFVALFQIATMFHSARTLARALVDLAV